VEEENQGSNWLAQGFSEKKLFWLQCSHTKEQLLHIKKLSRKFASLIKVQISQNVTKQILSGIFLNFCLSQMEQNCNFQVETQWL